MNIKLKHLPVMENEIIKNIYKENKGICIDATFGSGGHSRSILNKISKDSTLLVIDKDPMAIKIARKISKTDNRIKIYNGSFLSIKKICTYYKIKKSINNIIIDLGTSSMQLNNQLGFSFSKNSLLDMRMNPSFGLPASLWLSKIQEDRLSNILKVYGEEKNYFLISKGIKEKLRHGRIRTSFQLVNTIYDSLKSSIKNKHFATRTFQAIRIALNNELYTLKNLLNFIPSVIKKEGKLCIISFHSLEDRMIKNFFSNKNFYLRQTKKFITQKEEKIKNKNSRSAILRVFEKLV